MLKNNLSEARLEAELSALFRDMDRRLKRIRKLDGEIARLREKTQDSLDRMKTW